MLRRETARTAASPSAVVLMGVSGSGKSTVGRMLAGRLSCRFVDADDLHCAAARVTMAAGTPLTDEDRWPWLHRVGEVIAAERRAGGSVVVACSALRRAYRDLLREVAGEVAFVHLHGARERLQERLAQREGHFMPTALLGSQLATLELLEPDEHGLTIDIDAAADVAVERVLADVVASAGARTTT